MSKYEKINTLPPHLARTVSRKIAAAELARDAERDPAKVAAQDRAISKAIRENRN